MVQRPAYDVLMFALSEIDPSAAREEEAAGEQSRQNAFSKVWDTVLFSHPIDDFKEFVTERFEAGVEFVVAAIANSVPQRARDSLRSSIFGIGLFRLLVVGFLKLAIVLVGSDAKLRKRLEAMLAKLDRD